MGSLDPLHWIDVKSINGGRHQVGFDPEVHIVSRTLAVCLWFLLPASVCMLCLHTSLFNSNKKTPTFYFASWVERKKTSSYNHGKYLGFILNPSEFCACLSLVTTLGWGQSHEHQSSSFTKRIALKSRRQPTNYDTHRTHTPRQLKVWSEAFSEQSSSLKLLEEKRHKAIFESMPNKSWAWNELSIHGSEVPDVDYFR